MPSLASSNPNYLGMIEVIIASRAIVFAGMCIYVYVYVLSICMYGYTVYVYVLLSIYLLIRCILFPTTFLLDDVYVYTGTLYSTFTGYIHRLRGYHGLGHSSYYHSHNSLMMLKDGGELGMYIILHNT